MRPRRYGGDPMRRAMADGTGDDGRQHGAAPSGDDGWSASALQRDDQSPAPKAPGTLGRGVVVYQENCQSCHGSAGMGDGEAGKELSPPPANLAWLSRMPIMRSDSLLYWAIAEGGVPFGTGMPAFKDALSQDDIWAVITYLQAGLPSR